MSKIKTLLVHTPQGPAGELHHESRYVFNYTSKSKEVEIAIAMPLRASSYDSQILLPIFEMNRPEGFLLQRLHESLLKFGGVNDMRLLAAVGANTIGRVALQEPGKELVAATPMQLDEVLNAGPSVAFFDHLLSVYLASGVSGVQPKVLVPSITDRITMPQPNLIVKSAGATECLTQNEFICMDAARRAGICIPEFHLNQDGGLFVLNRFDRTPSGGALGFEDMAVVMGKRTTQKYEGSYENIAKAIQAFCGSNAAESLHRFFAYLTLSVMVRNGDAHLKNFGLIYEHPASATSVRLSPLYDVVTTTAYAHPTTGQVDREMALKLDGNRRYPTRDALLRFGRTRCHMQRPETVIDQIAQAMQDSWRENEDRLPHAFAERMRAEWEHGLSEIAVQKLVPVNRGVQEQSK